MESLGPFLEVLIGGLLSGVLYSLVALGFVLIFKASGVFNFAQGAMVLLAGLALVRPLDWLVAQGLPFWAAVILGLMFAAAIMALSAWVIERFVLGPLVTAPVAESAAYSQVKTASAALKGLPSCQTTPFFRRQVTAVPSRARPPLSRLGISAARIGMSSPSGLKPAKGS